MAARLLTALRDHLTSEGLVRKPTEPGSLPPMWLEPQVGVNAPGEGDVAIEVGPDIVIGAYQVGGLAPGPYESYRRDVFVELRLRTRQGYMAEDVEQAITAALIDRRDFILGDLQIIECEQILALQRLGSDAQGFEHLVQYQFELYRQ